MRLIPVLVVAATTLLSTAALADHHRDARADALADSVMERMGGRDAWSATRFVSWNFFGNRRHWWDRQTGDIRIEFADREGVPHLILMNINDKSGRAFADGKALEGEALTEMLSGGHQMWVNDSYWMFMPYKLRDPGARLKYAGEQEMEDGRVAEVLELTFGDDVGYTPQNKYEIWIGKESGLVEAWTFYADSGDAEPRFTMPWTGWQKFGGIMLATDHGRGRNWDIVVHESLDRSVFESTESIGDPTP